jgi:AAA domain-containing protein
LDRAIIDEVQRVLDLLLALKKTVDQDERAGRFLPTGSANVLTSAESGGQPRRQHGDQSHAAARAKRDHRSPIAHNESEFARPARGLRKKMVVALARKLFIAFPRPSFFQSCRPG